MLFYYLIVATKISNITYYFSSFSLFSIISLLVTLVQGMLLPLCEPLYVQYFTSERDPPY